MTKLVIHIDLRNTILVADTFTNTSVEAALASYLSSVAWGSVRDGKWEMESEDLSLNRPSDESVSYYTYVENSQRNISKDRRELREMTGQFVNSDAGNKVRKLYEMLLKRLKWSSDDSSSQFYIKGQSSEKYHFLLPSFFCMMHHLISQNIDFSIIIRTFGMDCSNALKCIADFLQNKHPTYKLEPNKIVKVNITPFYIKRGSDPCKIKLLNSKKEIVCEDIDEFYKWTNSSVGIMGIVDEYSSWEKNNYSVYWGKPFFVDEDNHTIQIMFDDNARPFDNNSIVNLIKHDRSNGKYSSLTVKEGSKYFGKNVFQVDLVEAILDEFYFKNKLS